MGTAAVQGTVCASFLSMCISVCVREISFANHILNYVPLSAAVEPSTVQNHSLQSLTSTFFTVYVSV